MLADSADAPAQIVDRLAFIAVPRLRSDQRGAQGALDAEAMSARLAQTDASFAVVTLDPEDDVAGQLDDRLAALAEPPDCVLFYASSRVVRADGELLLVLDGEHPETGDALVDVLDALTASRARNAFVLLDLRAQGLPPDDLVALAEQARAMAQGAAGVELAVAIRAVDEHAELLAQACSPFTRALLAELDETDPVEGLYAEELLSRMRGRADFATQPGARASHLVADSFPLLLAEEVPSTSEAAEQAPSTELEPPPADAPAGPDSATGARESVEISRDTEISPPPVPSSAPTTKPSARDQAPPAAEGEAPPASLPPASLPPPSIPPARPSTPPLPNDVLKEADRLVAEGQDEESLALYRKALSLVNVTDTPADADAERARIHARIGDVKLRQNKPREAIASMEKALSLSPQMAGADRVLLTLLTLYRGEKDLRSVHRVEERILSRLDSESELLATLIAFGKSWMTDLNDPLRARDRLEHARAIEPESREVARLLLALAEQDGRVEEARVLKRRLADLDPDPQTRAQALFELARDLLKHEREDEGLDLLEAALEADPQSLEPLALMSRMLGDRQEWGELEGAYRRMLERAHGMAAGELRQGLTHELEKRLALLMLEHLEDPEAALEAFERAIEARPSERGVQRAAVELAMRLGRLDVAQRILLDLIAHEPTDVAALHLLFEAFVKTDQVERAFDVASVLTALGAADDRERVVWSSHKTEDARPTGLFRAELWPLLRAPAGLETDARIEQVVDVFRAASSPLVRAFALLAERAGRLPPLNEALRVDPETSTVSVARSIAWAARTMGIAVPRVYLEEASREGLVAALREDPVTVAGAAALRGRTLAELSFACGYHLTGQLPEHRLVRLCAARDDLAACFLSLVVVAVPDAPVPERIRGLIELLAPLVVDALEAEQEDELERAVMQFEASGGRADLGELARAVERAGLRAGLLLSGSLEAALGSLELLPEGPLDREARRAELFAFVLGDSYRELRIELGLE